MHPPGDPRGRDLRRCSSMRRCALGQACTPGLNGHGGTELELEHGIGLHWYQRAESANPLFGMARNSMFTDSLSTGCGNAGGCACSLSSSGFQAGGTLIAHYEQKSDSSRRLTAHCEQSQGTAELPFLMWSGPALCCTEARSEPPYRPRCKWRMPMPISCAAKCGGRCACRALFICRRREGGRKSRCAPAELLLHTEQIRRNYKNGWPKEHLTLVPFSLHLKKDRVKVELELAEGQPKGGSPG